MLIADRERTLQNILQESAREIEKKGMNINYKTELMVVKKMRSSKCKLQIGHAKIKLVLKFKYLGIVKYLVIEDGERDICPPI